MIELTPLQQDALCEIFNIGVGHAASTMSQMVQEEVHLSVPSLQFLTTDQLATTLNETCSSVCAVRQSFEGNFHGDAMLLFPEEKSLEIVRMMIGESVPLEYLTDLEQDALTEVGNIILNACIASLSDIFAQQFECSLPMLQIVDTLNAFTFNASQEIVLFVHISFRIERSQIDGYLVFIMNPESLEQLRLSIERFLYEMTGGQA